VLSLFSAILAGCEEEKKPAATVDAGATDAGAGPVLGGRLGAAVAAAANGAPSDGGTSSDGGPPETGIFTEAAANAAQAPGAPPKVELLGEGSEPRVALAYALPSGGERKVGMLVSVRVMQQVVPPLAVDLVFKTDKPKDAKKKDEAAAAEPPLVTVKIKDIKPVRGELPKELAKVKDVVIRYHEQPNGALTDIATELPKDADAGIELIAGAIVDGLTAMITPLPSKPVGVGGYWMITDRARLTGVDVVRYRVVKVQKLDGKNATLSVEVRHYAANTNLGLPGLPKDLNVSLEKFDSQGKGEVEVGAEPFAPVSSHVQLALGALLKTPGQQAPPGRQAVVQTEVTASIGNTQQ
jgi:hypothetical protein